MENNIAIFKNEEFGNIRTVLIDDKPYFVASDVAKCLGYSKPNNAVNQHCKGATLKQGIIDNIGREQEMLVIPEGDIYRLIARSKLPTAEKFENWVADEVLPTIRKTGGYVGNEDLFLHTYLPNANEQTKLLFKAQLSVIKNLNERIEEYKPKVEQFNRYVDAIVSYFKNKPKKMLTSTC